ncbi:MAG: restriction endonuclease [Ignavibacteria bacterium]
MNLNRKHITVFEHQTIKLDQLINQVKFDEEKLKAFEKYYGDKGVSYFSLINKGIRFNHYVGVIQVGDLLIEVLPKADKSNSDKTAWRNILIGMLKVIGSFEVKSTSSSNLRIKPNTILDLYFELFIKEVEYLLHSGLKKKYRKKYSNVYALKGSLHFDKHIQKNLTHQERFFVRHSSYDEEHLLHFILYKTIRLLKQINTNASLHSRIGALLLYFPEMPDIKIRESTFNKLIFNRKTHSYKKAIEISKLILLQYHPDLSKGRNHVLALMFDMNVLWEKFVYVSLRKYLREFSIITAQTSKYFWKPENGSRSRLRPDIILNKGKTNCIVLDTKWKNLNGKTPSSNDLKQMYVYHEFYGAKKVALVYPGEKESKANGVFLDPEANKKINKECSVILLNVPSIEPHKSIVKSWQKHIGDRFIEWYNLNVNLEF